MEISDFQKYLPSFLTKGEVSAIKDQLANFPKNFNYYHLGKVDPVIGQADGVVVPKMVVLNNRGQVTEFSKVQCIVLSNTCDISLTNQRVQGPRVVLAPILSLTTLEDMFNKDAINAIRAQCNTGFFYLPDWEGKGREYFVQYDWLFTFPRSQLEDRPENIIFRLTQQGYYLFLMKLSINFCRFGEGPDLKRGS